MLTHNRTRVGSIVLREAADHAAYALEIERLNRLYSALSRINRAIVRWRTRDELCASVCELLVEHGGFRMAWIGWNDPDTHRLVPLSAAGDETGYLRSIVVFTDERPEGRGPSGTAFRDNRPYVCLDLLEDPATMPWRAQLEARGIRASAAFPIHRRGEVCGILSVYAEHRDSFQDKEVELLMQAATDLSFALDNLAQDEERQHAEEVVKRFVAIVESTDDAIFSNSLDGKITSWNPAAQRMFGYTAHEVIGSSIELLMPPDRKEEEASISRWIVSGGRAKQLETMRLRKDGSLFPAAITFSPIFGADETQPGSTKIVGVSKIIRDMTERKRAEAVAERERRFSKSIVEAMPGIFYLYDVSGRFLRWNRNFESVSGYSADEIEQLNPLDFFAGADKQRVHERIAEVFEKGESSAEAAFLTKSGEAIPYFFTGRRIVFDGSTCLVGVGVDIAERKRAEAALAKSEERYRTTLDNILEGCQLLDFDWRYLYLNPAAAEQNRRPNSELLGNRMPDAWPGIEGSKVFALLKRCMEERIPLHDEIEFAFADGSSGWFDVRVQPVPEGIFVLSIDISERKQAETALHELNESLELKVAERTADLEVAKVRAEAADRIKSAFLATMSHELRTPLNSILGFTGIVLQGMAGPLNEEQTRQLGMVQGSARHLLDLINDVLDISKIEAGQLEIRSALFDLRASIERVAASITPQVEAKGLKLHVIMPSQIEPMESDRRRIEQVLLNLLNNAIKFTEGGDVTLAVEIVDAFDLEQLHEPRKLVRFQVIDTGVGMKEEDLSSLFQPFRQLDSGLHRQHEGTGLGLAICRRLTELLGGTIEVQSSWGQGSVFTVVLPMKRT